MQYLKPPKYYEDLYDLGTIEWCLDRVELLKGVDKKMEGAKEIQHLTDEEKQRGINYMYNTHLIDIKLNRYKKRTDTIEEWIEEARIKQNAQDNTPPPKGIKCDKCKGKMHDTMHHLHTESDDEIRVLFFFECDKCDIRKGILDNGEEWIYKPSLCEKCNSELETGYKHKGNITTWTTKCTSCDYIDIDISDEVKEKATRNKKKKRDAGLLKKYRKTCCLEKKEAEKLINVFEEISFGNEVYKYELQRYADPVYEKSHNLKKLTVTELEKLLNKKFKKEKYTRLTLKEPELGAFIEIVFTTQDIDASRNKSESTNHLQSLLKEVLSPTNWRLNSHGITYRLGYLSGSLRGYERDEDILKLLGKKKEKKQQLDPEMVKKYGHSNAAKLAKISAKFEGERRIKMQRYKSESDGFVLETHGDNYYSCKLCYKSIKGNETWWLPEAQLCFNCHRNLKDDVYPIEIFENDKIWFRKWDLEKEFGLHHATISKYIRNGDLIARELKSLKGKTYHIILMAEDNIEFFKTHPRKGERKQRWHYVDGDGEVIWL